MSARHFIKAIAMAMAAGLVWVLRAAAAEPRRGRVIRLAELEIDPARLEDYKAALKEEIETSIRVEPGVLTLFAVSVKERPSQIRIFEEYLDEASYRAHLATPHFVKYKTATQAMVRALHLMEADPILLAAKPR